MKKNSVIHRHRDCQEQKVKGGGGSRKKAIWQRWEANQSKSAGCSSVARKPIDLSVKSKQHTHACMHAHICHKQITDKHEHTYTQNAYVTSAHINSIYSHNPKGAIFKSLPTHAKLLTKQEKALPSQWRMEACVCAKICLTSKHQCAELYEHLLQNVCAWLHVQAWACAPMCTHSSALSLCVRICVCVWERHFSVQGLPCCHGD